jgi:hypothetical protein
VTIAGIKAKIAMIERLKASQEKPRSRDTELMLDQLRIEQDIELAGALARRELLRQQHDRARALLRTGDAYDLAIAKAGERREGVASCEKRIDQNLKRLQNLDKTMGWVKVLDSIVIQPIKYPGE